MDTFIDNYIIDDSIEIVLKHISESAIQKGYIVHQLINQRTVQMRRNSTA